MASDQSGAKQFFATLPGLVTAIAGFVTAVGGLLLILNKTGCIGSSRTNAIDTPTVPVSDSANQSPTATHKELDVVSFSPAVVKYLPRSISYEISKASVEQLPGGEVVFSVQVRCVSESAYEYHFYSRYLRVRIGGDSFAPGPYSPSASYESVPEKSFKVLHYTFVLPVGTRRFQLVFSDEEREIGAVTVVVGR